MNKTFAIAALTGALAFTTACNTGSTATDLTSAEVDFLSGMIPHHQQAVEMAEMVPQQTDRVELLSMSEDIIVTQAAEIDEMTEMLEEAGEEAPESTMDGMGEDDMDMGGMMSEAEMTDLASVTDTEFDLMFIDMMVQHHQSAIEAAETVLDAGAGQTVTELANEIIDAQQAEMDQMRTWADAWR